MLTIQTKQIEINKELKNKVDMICKFSNTKPTYINGDIKIIKETNLSFIKPHIVIIKNNKFLIFNDSDYVFINNYSKKIRLKDLQEYIKKI